ncbi:MAG: SDR family NAD(P)-dependent oxidoreductase [Bacteroidota bacterium]
MNRFQEQIAIVAGGARGIGRGVVRRLAQEGAQVYIFDIREEELNRTLAEAKQSGQKIQGQILDITNESAVKASIEAIAEAHGRLDVLVNCAAIIGETGINIADFSTESFEQVVNVNLKGAFLLSKYAIPSMLRNNYGRIVHLSSIGGKEGNPGMVAYAASKSGLMGLVKAVGKEYAESGITVNGIAPAVIATEMNANTAQEVIDYMTAKIPMRRLGTIEEVTALCCWIASPEASFNTGYIFDISGGRATY